MLPHPDTDRDCNSLAHTNPDAYSNGERYSHPHREPDRDTYLNSHRHPHCYPVSNAHFTRPHTFGDLYCYCVAHGDPRGPDTFAYFNRHCHARRTNTYDYLHPRDSSSLPATMIPPSFTFGLLDSCPSWCRAAFRFLLSLLCTWHCFAITVPNFFSETPIQRDLGDWVSPYLTLTFSHQRWNMFTSIPLFRDIDAKLVVRFTDGGVIELEPVIPGFTSTDHNRRFKKFLLRLPKERSGSLDYYIQQVCREVRTARGKTPESVELIISRSRIRSLDLIRKDGVVSNVVPQSLGAITCPMV